MKRNVLVIIGVVVIVLAIAGVLGWRQLTASAATATRVQTTTVQRGTLVATVNAAGNVSAPEEAAMAFSGSGRVAQVKAQVGDVVKKGQLLMQLDTTDLDSALKTAQINLTSAQASLDATKTNLQDALKTAQANLVSTQASYDAAKAKNDQNPNQLLAAKAALDKAAGALQTAQANYNVVATQPSISSSSVAAALASATADYQSAKANYDITVAGINDTALRQAQASLDNAKTALDQAQKNLDTSLRSAQASYDNAKISADTAQRNLDKASIYAPFDGIVSAVNFNTGDTASSSTAVSIVDLNNLQVKVTIAEVDMPKIKVGETAQITLDAVPGQTYTAKVIAISPVGTVTQGVVNYPVIVAVNNSNGAVKPGMTANLAIEVDRRDNVLLVPTRAVRTQGNQKTVTVLYKGLNIPVTIGTGLSNDTSIEVTSGLQEGDQVVLNQTTTTTGGGRGIGGIIGGGPVIIGGPGGPRD